MVEANLGYKRVRNLGTIAKTHQLARSFPARSQYPALDFELLYAEDELLQRRCKQGGAQQFRNTDRRKNQRTVSQGSVHQLNVGSLFPLHVGDD